LAQDLIPNDVVRLRKEEKLKRSLAKKLRTLIDQFTDQASAVGEE
jgi:hypothetical protein